MTVMKENSYKPRLGDIGVVKSNGIFARLIQLGTLSRWNHAFIYIGGGQVVEATPKGVIVSPVSKYSHIAWNKHQVIAGYSRIAIANYALSLVGQPYGWLDIATIMLRILGLKILANTKLAKRLAQSNGYICSELCAETYQKCNSPFSMQSPESVTPGDIIEAVVYQ